MPIYRTIPCSPSPSTDGEPLGRNDTYGYALAAQPDQSQGRPTTNTGSQPTEQERPAHTCSPKAPVPDGRTVCPTIARRASGTTRGPPRHFIPGTNAIECSTPATGRAVQARGHFPTEQAALKCLYLAIISLDPKGTGQKRWAIRWKSALNAFAITFDGRLSAGRK